MITNTAANAVLQEAVIPAAIARANTMCQQLETAIIALNDRLRPVLRNLPGAAVRDNEKKGPSDNVAVNIHAIANRIEAQLAEIAQIQEKLEL